MILNDILPYPQYTFNASKSRMEYKLLINSTFYYSPEHSYLLNFYILYIFYKAIIMGIYESLSTFFHIVVSG